MNLYASYQEVLYSEDEVLEFGRGTVSLLQNKMLGRARDPHANGAWLSKLTE